MKRLIVNSILIINIVASVALLCSYLSQYYPPDKWWAPSFLGLLYPYLLAINLLFLIIWLIIKPVFSIFSLVVILSGWNMISRFIQISGLETGKSDIRLISYNVKKFEGNGKIPSREVVVWIKGFLKENEPDIICLQEVMLRTNNVFNLEETVKEFSNIDHYQYARAASRLGSVTMTRFPIIRMEEIRFENSMNIAICTDIVDKQDTFRIFNVHLQSYRIDPDRYDIIESPSISNKKNIKELIELGSKFKKATEMRAIQARLVRKKIDESPYPVIVCGDFNDTPSSYAYRKIKGNLRDAFICSGNGIGQTYIGKLPSFRIDYIFHSKNLESYNFRTCNIHYSDHLPVLCDLKIKN